jgi:hypothetical protein
MKQSDSLRYAHTLRCANQEFAPSLRYPASNSLIHAVMPDGE